MLRWFAVILTITLWGWSTAGWTADELRIAAASDLNFAFKELVSEFEKITGTRIKLSLGSSGNFYSQIQNGAPFDVFFSADIRYPQKLIEGSYAIPGSLYRYAVGRIVLWAPKQSNIPIERGLEVLATPEIHKMAIANPKHAPYGRAAVAALEHHKLYDRLKDRLVLGENISQAAQFVESGACDVGIIALSLAMSPTMRASGRYWEIPAETHAPIEQGAVLLKSAANPARAREFIEFLKGPRGQSTMQRYGFRVPEQR
jgi:molybdate transport system substrate-binding protein